MARVLLVCEDPPFVSMAKRVLRQQGYQVIAVSERDGVQRLVQQARPDLVLLDATLCPGESADLRSWVSQTASQAGVPFLVVTGDAEELAASESSGATSLRSRSVEPDVLLAAVTRHVTRTALVHSPKYAEYDYGGDHPLEPGRAQMTVDLCSKYDLLDKPWMTMFEPQPASREMLAVFHDEDYLEALEEANEGSFKDHLIEFGLGTEDCPVFPGVYDFSALVAGGTLLAAELVMGPEYDLAFSLAGGFHHARKRNAEGFCYVNDIAVAIKGLVQKGQRVAYVDLDAHHGDGVQDAFYQDDRVLTISLHESGKTLFPWSGFETEIGSGEGRGYNINVPLPPQTDDEVFLLAFNDIVPAALAAFEPDIVFTLIGADGLLVDPLSHLSLTNNSYAEATKVMEAISPRCVVLGGGGYHLNSVTRAWCLAWAVMNGVEPQDEYAGTIGGMMLGTEYVEGGGLRERHAYTTGPLKVEIRKEVERVTEYIKGTVFPLIGSGP
jgi:acetoin utilization protein AcuC